MKFKRIFVHLPGRTKAEAFAIGEEIANAVTKANVAPVKLKFEKVYYPCVLQTKKRYVGYSYESLNQKEPNFDAKGIETIRRDTCSVVSKVKEEYENNKKSMIEVTRVWQFFLENRGAIIT